MITPKQPRSYKIKLARQHLTSSIDLVDLPSPYDGSYRSIKETVVAAILSEVDDVTQLDSPVEVKVSGDGAPFSRISSYTLISFSLPSLQKRLSSEGVHTIAALKCHEDYETLKNGLAPVWTEINDLIADGSVDINNKHIPIHVYLGGDYKFLLTTMGLNQANSNYACLYCHVHKDDRWMVDRTFHRRTKQSISKCLSSRDKKGCKYPPLINIPVHDIVIDELHLMLGVTDVLLRNLIWAMEKMDNDERQRDFDAIIGSLNDMGPEGDLVVKTAQWVNSFLGIKTLEGHQAKNVTPYMHLMAMHVPHQVKSLKGMMRFSGQDKY